jgi:hypothetical protein
MDFLRAKGTHLADARYASLTPAQWACIALLGFGMWRLVRERPEARGWCIRNGSPPGAHSR